MVENGWMKSIKAALLSGLVGLLGFVVEAEESIVYYKAGYIGDHASTATDALKLTATSGGSALVYTSAHGEWTLIIDSNSPSGAQAWCADTVKYNNLSFKIVKVVIRSNFTFYPGVTANLFDNVEIEVAEGVKLTMTNYGLRNMSLGAVTFSGDGEVDASSGVAFTKPITTKGNVTVKTPTNTFVANVDGTEYKTLQEAFDSAKPSGTICVTASTWPTTNLPEGFKDSEQWQGTVQFTGTMPNGFVPSNYGNASSTIEFKGVSGGYLANKESFDGTLKVTNDGTKTGWLTGNGFSGENFKFGALAGDGDIGDAGGASQQYSFAEASDFSGNVTVLTKRFVIGSSVHDKTSRIYIEKGAVANIAADKTWDGQWAIRIDGTVKGSGTLASAKQKQIYFGYEPNVGAIAGAEPTIDLSEGVLTIATGCGVTFGSTLTLKNIQPGDTILKCASQPTNLETVTLKDESGATPSLWSLKYENGEVKLSGDVKKLSGNETWEVDEATAENFPTPLVLDLTEYYGEGGGKPVGETAHTVITLPEGTVASDYLSKIQVVYPTLHAAGELSASGNKIFFTFGHLDLYWNAWRGTFWEAVYGGDIHGNNGFGRTEAGMEQAILAGDTVIFDKEHYQVGGEFAEKSPYWHYDENLYIKDEVNPGVNNDWDLKVLEGVTLKMGLRGAKTTGQNIIRDFKIYVEGGSTLELGYWGNTHHYQGVIRPDVTFGGAGTITLGDDMGASCRIEGDLKVKGGEIPTLNVRGKELVVQGGQIDVNLTGFGALSGSGTITTPITFENATIDASTSPGFTFTDEVTIKGVLTAHVSELPGEGERVQLLTASKVDLSEMSRVVLVKDGKVSPLVYTVEKEGSILYAKVNTSESVTFFANAYAGYDLKTFLVVVNLSKQIKGVRAQVSITRPLPNGDSADLTQSVWEGTTDAFGCARILVGSPDEMLEDGSYTWTATMDGFPSEEYHQIGDWIICAGPIAQVNEKMFNSMQEAVAEAKESNGRITLLTNVFFAPPPGMYQIDRAGYDIMITNDMLWSGGEGDVEITAPETVDHYTVFERGDPFVIEGEWLGYALPWKTQKKIQQALIDPTESENGLKPFEAYVLGIPAAKMGTYKPIARGVQTADPNTIELTDGLTTKSVEKTGVVVTKKLIDADAKVKVSETTVYDLTTMQNRSALLKIGYSFAPDPGQ